MPIVKLDRRNSAGKAAETLEREAALYFEHDGPSALSLADRQMIEFEDLIAGGEPPAGDDLPGKEFPDGD